MMNKQEVIDEIENAIPDFILNDYQRGKETGLTYALKLVEELDEPEKPVIPQYVAEQLEVCKENLAISLAGSMNPNVLKTNNQSEKTIHWLAKNQETFVKAWLYGYEVEKEKLYTVKFANEDFGKMYIGFLKRVNKLGVSSLPLNNDEVKSWFTEDELKRFKFWNNSAFEVVEVEK